MDNNSIFTTVQERFSIINIATELGLIVTRIGSSYRSDSLDTSCRGENALAFYENTNTWFDFVLKEGGDITDLVARVKFNGDKKQALHYLMPDFSDGKISQEIKRRNEFMQSVERWHNNIFDGRPQHVNALNYLHSRRITDDTIRELKIGVDPAQGTFRILFPFWDEGRKNILYYVTRRYDWRNAGEDEKAPKYKNASLSYYPFLRNAPLGLNTLHRMKDDTLIITEGIFDWLAFYQEGYSVLASHGGDFGKQWKEVLEKIKSFKRVILAYDSDNAGQEFTYKAAKVLLQHRIPFYCTNLLTKDVAEHYALTGNLDAVLSSVQQGFKWFIHYIVPKKGFDELSFGEKDDALNKCKAFIKEIAAFSDSADVHGILMNLRSYFPKDWIMPLFEIARKGPSQLEVADKIRTSHSLMYNPRAGFYEYQSANTWTAGNGTWKQIDDEVVMGYIINALGKFATGGKVSSILKLIKSDNEIFSEIPITKFNTLPRVSFLNGTLHINLDTGNVELKPHSMYDYVTIQLPFCYEPKTVCSKWRKFISEITNNCDDDAAVLQEYSGSILIPNNRKYHKALMLKGGGSNGKSVFFNIIEAVFGGIGVHGNSYVSHTEPSKWAKDFRLMPLRNSWVNISNETETDLRGSEGVFKKITSGDSLEDSYKHKDPIAFNTRAKLMMACNYFPTVSDTSDGFMRRWLIVELPMHYVPKEQVRPDTCDRELNPFLEDELMKELPGIFNWIVEGLQRLIKQKGFTHTKNHDSLIKEFREFNDPLYAFVDESQECFKGSDEGHIVQRHTIFMKFIEWAQKNNVLPMPSNRFYSNMRSVFHSLSIPFAEEFDAWIFFFRNWDDEEVANW